MTIEQHEADAATIDGDGDRSAARRTAWIVLALLVGLMIVNYADKVVVGFAGTGMMRELGIDEAKLGLLQSIFYLVFPIGALLGGWLGGKISARWLLGGLALLWALSLAPMAFQVGFGVIVLCRVLLAFAEGPTTALAMQVTHSWFPAHKRAVPSSIVVAGAGIGPVIAAPVLTWIVTEHDWHLAFTVLAAVGALVALLWILAGRSGPEGASSAHGDRTVTPLPERLPWSKVFGNGTMIGTMLLFFVAYACTAVKVSWLPLYLKDGVGYDEKTAGNLSALPYLGAVIAVIAVGMISAAMTKRGVANRITRGILPAGLVLVAGLTTAAFSQLERGWPQMALVVLGSCLNSAGYGVAFAGLSDVIPAKQRATALGVVTAFYSLGGVIAPLVIGNLVAASGDSAAGYGDGFLILGITMTVGALAAYFLVNPDRDAARLTAEA